MVVSFLILATVYEVGTIILVFEITNRDLGARTWWRLNSNLLVGVSDAKARSLDHNTHDVKYVFSTKSVGIISTDYRDW